MINRESYYLTLLFNSERKQKSPCCTGRFFTACIYQDTLNYSSFLCFFLLTNTITKVKEKASKTPASTDSKKQKPSREERGYKNARGKKDDWKQFFKDEEPDFSEEGWARRKPKKK